MELNYFEDYDVGQRETSGSYTAVKEEFMELARKWDPQPFHVDEEAADKSIYGGVTAPSLYIIGVTTWLNHQFEPKMVSMGLIGYQNMRFPNPVRHGDKLSLVHEVIEKRQSQSKSDRGIIVFRGTLSNQHSESVLVFEAIVLMRRRTI